MIMCRNDLAHVLKESQDTGLFFAVVAQQHLWQVLRFAGNPLPVRLRWNSYSQGFSGASGVPEPWRFSGHFRIVDL
jgi:hypothetical protein